MEPTPPPTLHNDGASTIEKHGKYYFEFVSFLVEKTLFRVPKGGFLRHNPAFFDRLNAARGVIAEDQEPIELKGISAEDFHGLLLVVYPFEETASTYDQWLGALDLATQWGFPEVRAEAIGALEEKNVEKTAVERVLLAKKFSIGPWLREAYADIIMRADLVLDDLKALDWETKALLFAAQSQLKTFWALNDRPLQQCRGCDDNKNCDNCLYSCNHQDRSKLCDPCGSSLPGSQCACLCGNWQGRLPDRSYAEETIDEIFSSELSVTEAI